MTLSITPFGMMPLNIVKKHYIVVNSFFKLSKNKDYIYSKRLETINRDLYYKAFYYSN